MDKKVQPYCMPDGFNPYHAADALLGLAAAVHRMVMEGQLAESSLSDEEYFSLCGLVTLMHEQARALHDYLLDIENRTTVRLPRSDADFEKLSRPAMNSGEFDQVKEPAAVYAIRR